MYKIDYKPIEHSLSKVETLMELIQGLFRDNGQAIKTTYIQHTTNYACIGFDNMSINTLWSDQATDCIQVVKFQLEQYLSKECFISVEKQKGTVWIRT